MHEHKSEKLKYVHFEETQQHYSVAFAGSQCSYREWEGVASATTTTQPLVMISIFSSSHVSQ